MSASPPDSRKDAPRLHAVAAAGGAPARKEDPDAILRRLEWTVIRRLDGLLQGDYRTLFRAFGLDLLDLRDTSCNDDVRHRLERHCPPTGALRPRPRRPRSHAYFSFERLGGFESGKCGSAHFDRS
jgi:hypothetical protein